MTEKNIEHYCVFCGKNCEYERLARQSGDFYRCPDHGEYIIFDGTSLHSIKEKSLISEYLFETRARAVPISLTTTEIDKIKNAALIPKTSMQKIDKIMNFIYQLDEGFGTKFTTLQPYVDYAKDVVEMDGMLRALCDLGYIFYNDNYFYVTVKGLEYAEKLLTINKDSTKVFVAMGFKEYLLNAYENAIKPACSDWGFQAFIVSDREHNNDINDEIIAGIKTSKFVITDFTYNNAGAYFEAGFAQGLGLPVIRCCKSEWFNETDDTGHKINHLHFDIEHYNMIIWKTEGGGLNEKT